MLKISIFDRIYKFLYGAFVFILSFLGIFNEKKVLIPIKELPKEHFEVLDMIVKRAKSKWPTIKISNDFKKEFIIITGGVEDCDAVNAFILEKIKLIRCDKLHFIEEILINNSDQIIKILQKVITDKRLLFSKLVKKADGYYLVNAIIQNSNNSIIF